MGGVWRAGKCVGWFVLSRRGFHAGDGSWLWVVAVLGTIACLAWRHAHGSGHRGEAHGRRDGMLGVAREEKAWNGEWKQARECVMPATGTADPLLGLPSGGEGCWA
jgi:hypothetical protein